MVNKENKKINKWIDLSSLQRTQNNKINWDNAIGCTIPFVYDDVCGKISIISKVEKGMYNTLVDVCGYTREYLFRTSNLLKCRIGMAIKKPISVTNPELTQYFVNKDDAYKYTPHSSKKVPMICPVCGELKYLEIYVLSRQGFACPRCSDNISYPNKFMFNILKQLNINFEREVGSSYNGFAWTGTYKYDFYLQKNGRQYFIEMDGQFHSCENIKEIDKIKDSILVSKPKSILYKLLELTVNILKLVADLILLKTVY